MKKKLLILVAVVAIVGVAAFVVAGKEGKKVNPAELERIRGTDSYYSESDLITKVDPMGIPPDLVANCADAPKLVKLAFDVQYKIGQEWTDTPEMAGDAFTKHATEIRSAMILMIGSKKSNEMIGGSNSIVFMEEIRKAINEIVFPTKMARVEKVLVKSFIVQG